MIGQSQQSQQDHGAMTEQDKHEETSTYDTPSRPASVEPPVETFAEKHTAATSEFNTRSVLALIGAFALMFCSVGFVNAFGVFQEYYAVTILSDKSPSDISWLGSFNVFCMFGMTFVAGFLTDKYGPTPLVCGGSLVTLFALFMTSICKEYWQLFLAQGFLLGIGIAFIVLPGFTTPAQHFAKSRGMALGIVVSGSSLGGVIWPIALHNLFTEVGFGWAVRIVAFIQLPLLVIGCVFTRPPVGLIGHAKGKADFSCMKNPILILLSSGLFLLYLGLFTPFFFITSWTESLGLDSDFAFYTISIINGASLFGRILPGILADRIGPYNIAILAATISGLICTCLTKATTVAGISVLSLAYGFSSGTQFMSLTVEDLGTKRVCASKLVPPSQFGVAMGSVMTFLSVAGLVGSPINGQILNVYGYLGISLFSGLAMLIGALIIVAARLKLEPKLLAKA
ncbi:MFS monocarboxylate transporter protein [Rutstroemia sp. NJR-2017a BBW]|nr:MFS monocarboxylate transporter protein [Rutstroemia sp. NJR-2017a BBW]